MLLKGAFRRVFSRSDLRRKILDAAEITHSDIKRPRVTKWVRCAICGLPTPKYLAAVDHIDPLIPINIAFEHMNLDTVIDRMWCEEKNLQVVDATCHAIKSKQENKERRMFKKGKAK